MYFIVVVGFGLLFAWLCSNTAKKQGRDTTLAGVLGLFFGIFAWFVYLILGDQSNTGGINEHKVYLKHCPYCSEEIQETAKKCKHCGERLTDGKATKRK